MYVVLGPCHIPSKRNKPEAGHGFPPTMANATRAYYLETFYAPSSNTQLEEYMLGENGREHGHSSGKIGK
jgi:hypothetical protein